jgi:hypothetical protein
VRLVFDVYSGLDPNGTSLGELTHASDKQIRLGHADAGSGTFTLNRHDAQAAICTPGNLVKVKLDSGSYVHAFWLDEGADTVVSPDEEGGETYTRSGRGALAYLERARVYPSATMDTSGNRPWRGTYGQIMAGLILEAQARGALPDLTYDFTATLDSKGTAWAALSGAFLTPVGRSYFEVATDLQSAGVIFRMDPDLTLHAYVAFGTDHTGTISFRRGVNIRETSEREVHSSQAISRVVVQGTTAAGTLLFREVTGTGANSGVEAAIGRREGFLQYEGTADTTMLDAVGQQAITASRYNLEGPTTIGVTIGDGTQAAQGHYVPLSDYEPGDSVKLTVSGEWSNKTIQIGAVTLNETEAGATDPTIEFSENVSVPLRVPGNNPGGGGGGPPIVPTCAGITDTFNRVVTGGLDRADCGWYYSELNATIINDRLVLDGPDTGGSKTLIGPVLVGGVPAYMDLPWPFSGRIDLCDAAESTDGPWWIDLGAPSAVRMQITASADAGTVRLQASDGVNAVDSTFSAITFPAAYTLSWNLDDSYLSASIDGWGTLSWSAALASGTPGPVVAAGGLQAFQMANNAGEVTVLDNLDIDGLCAMSQPTSGQRVEGASPLESPDGIRLVFTTPTDYVAGSLWVETGLLHGVRTHIGVTELSSRQFEFDDPPTDAIFLYYTQA